MIEYIGNKYFHLKNSKVSYIFYLMPNQQLGHLYYGKALDHLSESDLDYLAKYENKAAGTVKFSEEDSAFTLSDRPQEYPVYGTSDFRSGAVEMFDGETPLYLDFKYHAHYESKGKERVLSKPATYAEANESETLTIVLTESEHDLKLELNYTIFEESTVIAKNQRITNTGKTTKKITKMLSGHYELPSADYDFLHLSGAWLKERHITRHNLAQGTVSISSLKGASGHQHNPFIALQHKQGTIDTGEVFAMNLIYSGNFLGQAEVDEWDNTRLMLGIHPDQFSWTLKPDKIFETPECILGYSDKGLNGLASEYASFIERHIIDRKWQGQNRPIVINNWEATYFDFDQEKLLKLAQTSKDIGIECFVVDDGWFSNRDSDRSSLGDWYCDTKKFPDGLKSFADKIHQMDLQLGIWFEPEMVSPDSKLYQQHPEWVVRHLHKRIAIGRGQYVLDFANPEVVDNIFQQMKKVIEETNLDYIKWYMNRNITEAYSTYLEQNGLNQTEFFHRYTLGVYELYTKILTEFPNVLIEGCAGGGGRYDLGILYYSPQIWPSDDSDAVERLKIQSGTLLAYPLSSFSNHVSVVPNHQVGRMTSMKMRQDVAMFGPLGYELDLDQLTESEKKEISERILFYKQHRALLTFGTFRQLIELDDQNNEYCWSVYDEATGEAMVGFYRILAEPNPSVKDYIRLPFVSETEVYQVNDETVSGQILKQVGIRKPYQFNGANHDRAQVKGDFQSYIYHIKSIKQ